MSDLETQSEQISLKHFQQALRDVVNYYKDWKNLELIGTAHLRMETIDKARNKFLFYCNRVIEMAKRNNFELPSRFNHCLKEYSAILETIPDAMSIIADYGNQPEKVEPQRKTYLNTTYFLRRDGIRQKNREGGETKIEK